MGRTLAATAVLALLVLPVAIAGSASDSGDPQRIAHASVKKKLKKLRGQVRALQRQVDELAQRPGVPGPAGPPGARGVQGPPGPAGSDAEFEGAAAGGALAGTYPDPSLAANLNNVLDANDIADNGVGSPELAGDSVDTDEIGPIQPQFATVNVPGNTAANGSVFSRTATAQCDGNEQAVGGGTQWDDNDTDPTNNNDDELYTVEAFLDTTLPLPDQYFGRGANDTANDRTFRVWIYCLDPDPSP